MLVSMRELQGYRIEATDGSIGRVHELLFDDIRWVIRYVVIDTGPWLPGRRVLISPISVDSIDGVHKRVLVRLDKGRIRTSPDIYTDQPVSRQKEAVFNAYYGYGSYWAGPDVWGPAVYPRELRRTAPTSPGPERRLERRPNKGILISGARAKSPGITSRPPMERWVM
jgi:hypothetical protein